MRWFSAVAKRAMNYALKRAIDQKSSTRTGDGFNGRLPGLIPPESYESTHYWWWQFHRV
jgi:hypothetical protein